MEKDREKMMQIINHIDALIIYLYTSVDYKIIMEANIHKDISGYFVKNGKENKKTGEVTPSNYDPFFEQCVEPNFYINNCLSCLDLLSKGDGSFMERIKILVDTPFSVVNKSFENVRNDMVDYNGVVWGYNMVNRYYHMQIFAPLFKEYVFPILRELEIGLNNAHFTRHLSKLRMIISYYTKPLRILDDGKKYIVDGMHVKHDLQYKEFFDKYSIVKPQLNEYKNNFISVLTLMFDKSYKQHYMGVIFNG